MKTLYAVLAIVCMLISLVIYEVNQTVKNNVVGDILGIIDYIMMLILPPLFIYLYLH